MNQKKYKGKHGTASGSPRPKAEKIEEINEKNKKRWK